MGKHFFRLRMGKAQAQREPYFSKTDFSRLFGYEVFSYGSVNPCQRIFLDNFIMTPFEATLKTLRSTSPAPNPSSNAQLPSPPTLTPPSTKTLLTWSTI